MYIRRGSSTDQATPDEIADMGRDESALYQKEEKAELFWKMFKMFLSDLDQKISYLKNTTTNHIYESTIAENRLPIAQANNLLKQASEIDLGVEFHIQITKLVDEIRIIDEYMNLGVEKLTKMMTNFYGKKESLYELVSKMKQQYLK